MFLNHFVFSSCTAGWLVKPSCSAEAPRALALATTALAVEALAFPRISAGSCWSAIRSVRSGQISRQQGITEHPQAHVHHRTTFRGRSCSGLAGTGRLARLKPWTESRLRPIPQGGGAAGGSLVTKAPAPSWIGACLLGLAIMLEVFASTSMKLAQRNKLWMIATYTGYAACFTVFPHVLRYWPISIAYAIWSGMGTAAMAVIGNVFFSEALGPSRLFAIALIIAGVVRLNMV